MPKLKEILASKLKKIAKTQVFGKSTCVHAPPDYEKKPDIFSTTSTYLDQVSHGWRKVLEPVSVDVQVVESSQSSDGVWKLSDVVFGQHQLLQIDTSVEKVWIR